MLTAGIACFALAQAQTPDWPRFESRRGQFSCAMPSPVREEYEFVGEGETRLTRFSYRARETSVLYEVSFIDLPAAVVDGRPALELLRDARDGTVTMRRMRLVEEGETLLAGWPSVRFRVEIPQAPTIDQQMALVGRRLFHLMVVRPAFGFDRTRRDRFFAGFQLAGGLAALPPPGE